MDTTASCRSNRISPPRTASAASVVSRASTAPRVRCGACCHPTESFPTEEEPPMATHDDRQHTTDVLDEERLGRTYRAILGDIPPHVRTRWATLVAAGRARTVEAIEE